ncbi:hypothetical protein H4582DRAFT_2036093 [Lactarius indigo]|nr:hypothetical protein H4582DRAFT_2036093 [Lactarius indigo]
MSSHFTRNIQINVVFYDDQYKQAVYDNLFVGIVYGIYTVLYVASVHVLLNTPGFTSSRPRMFMFGITTSMFSLGIITLVLRNVLGFQDIQYFLGTTSANTWSFDRFFVVLLVEGAIARLMVRLHDTYLSSAWLN